MTFKTHNITMAFTRQYEMQTTYIFIVIDSKVQLNYLYAMSLYRML